jgi:mono/diheme cytochrome c family protein
MKQALLKASIVFGVFIPLFVLLAWAADGNVEGGKKVYLTRCKMCHGADGAGNPAMARMLKVEFKSLDSDYVQDLKDDELVSIITKGKGKMAAVRGLNDQQLADVIAYLRALGD